MSTIKSSAIMKYITDNMLNGLAEALPKSDILCETAVYAIRKDDDSSKTMKDAEIFRFLLTKKYELREDFKMKTIRSNRLRQTKI
jgi:hypothetical protein